MAAAEAAVAGVPATFDVMAASTPAAVVRVRDDVVRRGLRGCALARVPPGYYGLPLASRAALLQCPVSRLCKMLLFVNGSASASEDAAAPISRARHIGVVLQYASKLDVGALQSWLASRPGAPSDVRLTLAEDGEALTGFEHNGLSPFGSRRPLCHLVVSKAVARLPSPAFVWLGAWVDGTRRLGCDGGVAAAAAGRQGARPRLYASRGRCTAGVPAMLQRRAAGLARHRAARVADVGWLPWLPPACAPCWGCGGCALAGRGATPPRHPRSSCVGAQSLLTLPAAAARTLPSLLAPLVTFLALPRRRRQRGREAACVCAATAVGGSHGARAGTSGGGLCPPARCQ